LIFWYISKMWSFDANLTQIILKKIRTLPRPFFSSPSCASLSPHYFASLYSFLSPYQYHS
jgi:hypothetical protein